eukprot:CAMPEP_0115830048 /NCGR_PEP_ID=MMETSP0287-20121206/1416_1 /TAXON_ID=412157 /ORGANISM="Chrysochromulina rotalis, Strain UIO044" /LENGTH=249 /DNA_ID=CAMNT_0003283339 /DNA_START=17 /DNA_END=766 /DNA_ORIENTATION=-
MSEPAAIQQAVHVPPTLSKDDHVEHLVQSLREQRHSLEAAQQHKDIRTVIDHIEKQQSTKAAEILAALHLLSTKGVSGDAPGATGAPRSVDGGGTAVSSLGGGDAAHSQNVQAALESVSAAVTGVVTELNTQRARIDQSHELLERQLDALGNAASSEAAMQSQLKGLNSIVAALKEETSGVRSLVRAVVEDLRKDTDSLQVSIKEVKESVGSGGAGIFPLAVCAQALVLSAAFLYCSLSGGGKRRSHLP